MDAKNFLSSVGESIGSFFSRGKSSSTAAPRLVSPLRFPYGPFQFKFQLPKGTDYDIQASTNLETWQSICPGRCGSDLVDFVDGDASRFGHRFYRVLAGKVLSVNAIGFATVNAAPGYSLIANPLQATSNAVAAILPSMPEGTTLNKFDTSLFKLTENSVTAGRWSNPDETLSPGEGAIFFNPTSDFRSINLVGDVMQGHLLMPIAAGFSIRSSQIPKLGRLHSELGFPVGEGDVVHLFDRNHQKYVIHEYAPSKWESAPPVVGVGEAFWIGKTTPANWIQSFTLS